MPRPGRMTTERAKDFKGTLLQLVRNLGRYRLSLVTAIVFAILSTIFNIAGPKVLAARMVSRISSRSTLLRI